jgi:hypothetical protein
VIELDENFLDKGDEQDVPWRGETIVLGQDYSAVGGPPLHPNCRCVLVAELDEEKMFVQKGGPGSGNFGHEGRPGEVGGSGPGGGEGGIYTVYHGSTIVEGTGSGVGATLGSGLYVTSNRDKEGMLSAQDYAGGKYTSGKQGRIDSFSLDLTHANFLDTDKHYDIRELAKDTRLSISFRNRMQTWADRGWYKEELSGSNLINLIQAPPPDHGPKMDIGKVGFDAIGTFNSDGSIYEMVVANRDLLKPIHEKSLKATPSVVIPELERASTIGEQ